MGRGPIDWANRVPTGQALVVAVLALVAVAAAIQLIPYGRTSSNPPVTGEPAWDSAATRELMVKVCFDCHSNEVDYPWYSKVAPVSWAVARHVSSGRDAVNYSEWNRPQDEADETIETIEEGSMPPWYYGFTHRGLSDAEKAQLIAGLRATPGMAEHEGEREHDDD